MKVYCVACSADVEAASVTGAQVYPHRPDLASLRFWRCPTCRGFVGCHRSGKPLGCIPTPELKRARQHIHALLDPAWKSGRFRRSDLYKAISAALGREYHTAELRSVEEARVAYRAIAKLVCTVDGPR